MPRGVVVFALIAIILCAVLAPPYIQETVVSTQVLFSEPDKIPTVVAEIGWFRLLFPRAVNLLLALLGVSLGISALFLMIRKNWARKLFLAQMGLYLILGCLSFFQTAHDIQQGRLEETILVNTLMYGVVVLLPSLSALYFFTQQKITQWFNPAKS